MPVRVPPNVERVKAIRGNVMGRRGYFGPHRPPAALEALPTARQSLILGDYADWRPHQRITAGAL